MATYFVSKSGSDGAAGTKAAPWLTLDYAYNTGASDGDAICLLDPYGEWFENWSALGYIQFAKASMTTGIHIYSYDPRRPARIGGDPTASGTFSVRIATAGHRFSNVDIYSSSASNTTIFGCNSSSVMDNVRLRGCRIVNYHDISSASSAYMIQLAGTGVHTGWNIEDCVLDPGPAHNLNGIYTGNSDGFRVVRTKVLLPRYGTGYAMRIYLGSVETYILDSELDGNYGILQDTAAQAQDIIVVGSKISGRTYAASFGGTSSGTCTIFMRSTKLYGDSIGLAGQSNTVFDAEGVESVSDNVAIGMPTDGAYTNTQALMENCKSSAFGISGSGHALLFGVGSVSAVVNGHIATARRSTGWAAVFKGTGGFIEDSHFVGGGNSTCYFKGAVDWTMSGCHLIQEVGGSAIEVKNGDTTPLSSGLKIINTTVTVTNGELFDWGNATHEDETGIVNYNKYQVLASGTWGNIQGVAISSLATLQAEWDSYPVTTNDDHSVEDSRNAVINDLTNTQTMATRWLTMVAVSSGSIYQYTADAVELAPSGGGGGDATAANQVLILAGLVELMGAGFATGTDSNAAIRAAVDGLSLGAAPQLLLSTTIASVTSQLVLVLTAGSADNNAYDGMSLAIIVDQATATQKSVAAIASYVGGTLTLTLATTPRFTVAAGDAIYIIAIGRPDVNLVSVQNETVDIGDLEFNTGNSTPVEGDQVNLVPGDTYSEATGNSISFTDATWDFTGVAAVKFTFRCKRCGEDTEVLIDHSVGAIDAGADRVYFELTSAQTDELEDWIGDNPDEYSWDVEFHYAGDVVVTKLNGPGTVIDPVDE